MLTELSFRHAFYLVRIVRVEDVRVAWRVYVRTYCVPIVPLNQNKRSRLLHLGDAQVISFLVSKRDLLSCLRKYNFLRPF